MVKIIEAIYEDGVFKPLEKVELKDGEKVKLRLEKGLFAVLQEYHELLEDVEEDLTKMLIEERK
ncbi:MAG: antitoxin family protein [Archaeoglobales archaeon]|nr:antitoxin family protein [Archaeoglobales archaeon]